MSIASRAKTRPRAEAIVAHLKAHADFVDLTARQKLMICYSPSPNGKHGLDKRLEARVGKIQGILITVTPVGGKNASEDAKLVRNDSRYAVNVWSRPVLDDDKLPDPADMADEVQRVLQGFTVPASGGGEGSHLEALKVGAWVEVSDPTYLNHEIQVTTLVPLGKATA